MFTLGIILLTIGFVLRIWMRLSVRQETRAMSPRPVNERSSAIDVMWKDRRWGVFDSKLFIIAGTILVLITAVFN